MAKGKSEVVHLPNVGKWEKNSCSISFLIGPMGSILKFSTPLKTQSRFMECFQIRFQIF